MNDERHRSLREFPRIKCYRADFWPRQEEKISWHLSLDVFDDLLSRIADIDQLLQAVIINRRWHWVFQRSMDLSTYLFIYSASHPISRCADDDQFSDDECRTPLVFI